MNRKQRRISQSLARTPGAPAGGANFAEGLRHLQAGRLAEAEAAYRKALERTPRHAPTLHHLGLVAFKKGAKDEAVRLIRESLSADGSDAKAWLNLAVILSDMPRHREAIEACEQSIARDATVAEPFKVLGGLHRALGAEAAAVDAYKRALVLDAGQAVVHIRCGESLLALGNTADAMFHCTRALELEPASGEARVLRLKIVAACQNVGSLAALHAVDGDQPGAAAQWDELARHLRSQNRYDQALDAGQRAVDCQPENGAWYFNLAATFEAMARYENAFVACKNGLDRMPEHADGYVQLGLILRKMGMYDGAITALEHAAKLAPSLTVAHHNLAVTYKLLGRTDAALESFRRAIACEPDAVLSRFELGYLRRIACDWAGLDDEEAHCLELFRAKPDVIPPFMLFAAAASAADQHEAGRRYARKFAAADTLHYRNHALDADGGRRLRIGYLSSDFYKHATALLLAEVLELHDRSRFEIFGYCYSNDDGSDLRRRLVKSFDRFTVVKDLPHAEAAQRIYEDNVDILIDLKGYTRDARPEIVSYRPAPIQVNYLGYPATMGAGFIDYIIADRIVAPTTHQALFSECIVHLPGCYQPNDRTRKIADVAVTRAEAGLPDGAFVFCSFNNSWKLNAATFDIWARLLKRVPDAVLWLLAHDETCQRNLRQEAASRGLDPSRLVFAKLLPNDEHLARHRLADLFLDSLPCNAHTTASDALWAGLPVLTCTGDTFAGRVATSLVTAMGLNEMVAGSLEKYEELAVALATDRDRLAAIKAKLAANRNSSMLFDTALYTRNLERAYETMAQIRLQERAPRPFAVPG